MCRGRTRGALGAQLPGTWPTPALLGAWRHHTSYEDRLNSKSCCSSLLCLLALQQFVIFRATELALTLLLWRLGHFVGLFAVWCPPTLSALLLGGWVGCLFFWLARYGPEGQPLFNPQVRGRPQLFAGCLAWPSLCDERLNSSCSCVWSC